GRFCHHFGGIDQYFAGTRRAFDLPLNPGGSSMGTTFQRAVWSAIAAVPLGATTSYAALAASCGKPSASRASGAATGRNPISLLIPCHRILGSNGALTGYAGGLERKRALLAFERAVGAGERCDIVGFARAEAVATSSSSRNPQSGLALR
ncbi:MAG: methylated-DNA--[protein]-cysteine S-methyltransferase, partial [Betaproteobacteria bacterium]